MDTATAFLITYGSYEYLVVDFGESYDKFLIIPRSVISLWYRVSQCSPGYCSDCNSVIFQYDVLR